jgi:hypothetical protein
LTWNINWKTTRWPSPSRASIYTTSGDTTEGLVTKPAGAQAHHVFPVKFGDYFARLGIDINDPQFGAWVAKAGHEGFSYEYNLDWQAFLETNPTRDQVLNFGREMAGKYGFNVGY